MFALKYFVLLLIQAILLVLSVSDSFGGIPSCQSDEKLARLDRCPALYYSSLSKIIRTEYGIDVRRIPLWNQWICCPKPGNELPDTDICGQSPAFFRIKNGTQAQPNGFPWMAMLIYKNDTSLIFESSCAGSLINHRYVLTAAHCVSNMPDNYSLEFVRLGEHDITYNPINKIYRDVNVEEIIPYHADSQPNDIALLRLAMPVRYRDEITPICVLKNPYIAQDFVIAGWGVTENGKKSNVLMRGNIKKTNSEKCKRRYINEGFNDSVQICAGGQTSVDTCSGDSGSPLMASKGRMDKDFTYVAGITSFGSTICGKNDTPSVYTRTSAFFDWIVLNLRP